MNLHHIIVCKSDYDGCTVHSMDTTTLYWWYYNTVLMILQHCTDDTTTLYWWYYNTVLMILQVTVLMILQHCTDDTTTLYWWYYWHCTLDDTSATLSHPLSGGRRRWVEATWWVGLHKAAHIFLLYELTLAELIA